jgi:RNA polymerase sigma factor (sigma-70 family)
MADEPVGGRQSRRPDAECAALFRRYGGDVLRYCRSKLAAADAEDVAQQVFVRAYGALLRGEHVRLPRHWLLRIARNECRRHAERARRVDLVDFDEAIDVPPPSEPPEWTAEEIRRALDELVPAQRDALVLRELEGRSYAEIAGQLRLSVAAVDTLIFRARRALREQLDGAIACGAAEQALSLELDGRLADDERPRLRAHLRACGDCRRLARRHRARRHAVRTLAPLPFHGHLAAALENGSLAAGGALAGSGVAFKAAAALTAGAVSAGLGIQVTRTPNAQAAKVPPVVAVETPSVRPAPANVSIAARPVPARAAQATSAPPRKRPRAERPRSTRPVPPPAPAATPSAPEPTRAPGPAPQPAPPSAPPPAAPPERERPSGRLPVPVAVPPVQVPAVRPVDTAPVAAVVEAVVAAVPTVPAAPVPAVPPVAVPPVPTLP